MKKKFFNFSSSTDLSHIFHVKQRFTNFFQLGNIIVEGGFSLHRRYIHMHLS